MRWTAAALLFAAPVLLQAVAGRITWRLAIFAAVAIWVLKVIFELASKSSVFFTSRNYTDTNNLLNRLTELLDETEVKNHANGEDRARRNDDYIKAILSVIEVLVLRFINVPRGKITVTFARYIDDGRQLELRHRNRGSDRKVCTVPVSDQILGHLLCQAGAQPRALNDLHHLPEEYRVSPSSGSATYRSFYIVPIYEDAHRRSPVGFVSIDSQIPYAFYGNRANLMSTAVTPFIGEITSRL